MLSDWLEMTAFASLSNHEAHHSPISLRLHLLILPLSQPLQTSRRHCTYIATDPSTTPRLAVNLTPNLTQPRNTT